MKKALAVIFGGRTVEHDISIITAHQFMENADRTKYEIIPVYIARSGEWFTGDALRDMKTFQPFEPKRKRILGAYISPVPGVGLCTGFRGLFRAESFTRIDVAAIAMHGLHGEDGTVQGLLELADIPYTSAAVLGSSVGMDKIMMKAAFRAAGASVLEGVHFLRSEWEADKMPLIERAEALGYPLFVKPANLGSSIGIGRANTREELLAAVDTASSYDRRLLVEKGVDAPLEYNCACIGCGDEATVSEIERPVSWQSFLSFDEKYMRGAKSTGMKSLERELPAQISDELRCEIQSVTRLLFKELDCKGVVRIDYIFDRTQNKLYVNEINTIPGSFAFYLFEPLGISFSRLIDRLVDCALLAAEEKGRSNFAFDSAVLGKASAGMQKGAKQS